MNTTNDLTSSYSVAILTLHLQLCCIVFVIVNVIVRRLLSIDSNLLSILDIDTTCRCCYGAALQVVVGGNNGGGKL